MYVPYIHHGHSFIEPHKVPGVQYGTVHILIFLAGTRTRPFLSILNGRNAQLLVEFSNLGFIQRKK